MPEPDTAPKTVLMTGGSGFLGGWCIAALLDRGYSVRTTVRDLAREGHVRAQVGGRGSRCRRPAGRARRRPRRRRRLGGGGRGLRLRPARRLAVPAGAAQGPRRADRPGARRRPPGHARGARRRRRAGRDDLLGRGDRAAAVRPSTAPPTPSATGPTATTPTLTPYTRSKTIAERAAWELVRAGRRRGPARDRQPRRDHRPGAQRRRLLLAAVDRTAAEGHARRCRGSASPSSTCATSPTCTSARWSSPAAGGERFLATDGSCGWPTSARSCSDRLGDRRPEGPDAGRAEHHGQGDGPVRSERPLDRRRPRQAPRLLERQGSRRLGWRRGRFEDSIAETGRA